MKTRILILAAAMMLALAGSAYAVGSGSNPTDTVLGGAHDLSTPTGNWNGTSDNNALYGIGINQVCVFCHTPHNANAGVVGAPLWSKATNPSAYAVYTSASIKATVGQPGPVSKACLSCHDGTIAIGTVAFGQKRDKGTTENGDFRTYNHGRADHSTNLDGYTAGEKMHGDPNLGTDLSNDHPVGIQYVADSGAGTRNLRDPGTFANKAKLFGTSKDQVECASCHEVHNQGVGPFDGSEQTKLFLRSTTAGSAMCLVCHIK
jgi:hypothetical protein